MILPRQTTFSPRVIDRYCSSRQTSGGPVLTTENVSILKNATGEVGGYIVRGPIIDSPTAYLDAEGNEPPSFHVLDDSEKQADI